MPAQQTPRRRWTEQEFYEARDAAPAGERWELVDGDVLVTPSPHWSHQGVTLRLAILLDAYCRAEKVGAVFTSPLDVKLEPGMVTQPDVLVVPKGQLRSDEYFVRSLLLAVETLSPSSARFDRVVKRPHYQRKRGILDRRSGIAHVRTLAARRRAAGDSQRDARLASHGSDAAVRARHPRVLPRRRAAVEHRF